MDQDEVWNRFQPLWDDLIAADEWPGTSPLLAHYTSTETLEKVLRSNEVWMSNPLFMNDYEEVRFGILNGVRVIIEDADIEKAMRTPGRAATFRVAVDDLLSQYEREHLLDTYVLCLCEHSSSDTDGLLSMWRGYGGSGSGVAIVFDTSKLGSGIETSPLILSRVHYASEADRLAWLSGIARKAAAIIYKSNFEDKHIGTIAAAIFERIKLFALFSKHRGFQEEREWRLVYLADRDPAKSFVKMLGYHVGPRGVEPKLKLKVESVVGAIPENISLENIVRMIILGPTASSPLARMSVSRMMDLLGRPTLKDRLFASTIPLRG